MLEFLKLSIDDKEKINKYLQLDGNIMSDRCFASLCIWGPQFNLKYCIKDDFLYLVIDRDNRFIYYMPLGEGSLEEPVRNIKSDASERNVKHSIVLITEQKADEIQNLLGEDYDFYPNRDMFDYVYPSQQLMELGGKKLHSKRNFVNRFKKDFEGRWEYRDINPLLDKSQLLDLLLAWSNSKSADEYDNTLEYNAIVTALDNYEKLGLLDGCITLDGKIIAFTLAAPQNDRVVDILFEKADLNITGSFQMINYEFARHRCGGYEYINREEDLGLDGLRKSKLSYKPLFLTKKYVADFKG